MFFATYQILRLSWMNGKSVARCCLSMLPRNSGVQQVRHSGVPTFKMSTLSIFHDPDTNTFLHWSMDGCKTSTELCFVYIILYNYIHYIFFIEWLNDMRCMFSKKGKDQGRSPTIGIPLNDPNPGGNLPQRRGIAVPGGFTHRWTWYPGDRLLG